MLNKEIKIIGCKKCVALSAVLAVLAVVLTVVFGGNLAAGEGFGLKCAVALATVSLFSLLWFGWRFRNLGGFAPAVCMTFAMLVDSLVALAAGAVMGDFTLTGLFTACALSAVATSLVFGCLNNNAKLYKAMEKDELATMSVNQVKTAVVLIYGIAVLASLAAAVVAAVMGVTALIGCAVSVLFGSLCGLFTSLDVAANLWVVLRQKKAK